jgi:hypothetical protein
LQFVFRNADEPLLLRVDTAERPSLVQWTCLSYATLPDWAGTSIRFELAAGTDGGCTLTFRHHGLTPQLACYADCKNGWDHFLPSLCRYAETGVGDPWASAADLERRADRARRRHAPTP